jgi:hypothetical protein
MSGVTCQFCGKPLWRIRRGSEGDFCSREHRNQYKLRMGLSQLVEAEKVSSIRRRCEVCNSSSLGRSAGLPETQKRRPASAPPRRTGGAPLFPPVRMGSGVRLHEAAVIPALAVRRVQAEPAGPAVVSFLRQSPRVQAVGPLLYPGRDAAGMGYGGLCVRVPVMDGALRRPVFLVARFPQRAPGTRRIEARLPAPSRVAAAMPVARRERLDSAAIRRLCAAGFRLAPVRLPETGRMGNLADIPCVQYGLMPYRIIGNAVETRIGPQGQLIPVPAVSAGPDFGYRAAAAGVRRPLEFAAREVAPWPADSGRTRSAPWVGYPLVVPMSLPRVRARAGVTAKGPGFVALWGRPMLPPGSRRTASPARSPRPPVRGRRAGWNGRARLPGSNPQDLIPVAKNSPARSRPAGVVASRDVPSLPRVLPLAERTALSGPRHPASGARGSAAVRPVQLTPRGRDLLLASFRPGLRGRLTDPIPGQRMRVLEDHFGDGLGDWSGDTALWKVDIAGVRPGGRALFEPSLRLTDYRLEFLARVERGTLGCLFRVNGDDCHAVRIGEGGSFFERCARIAGQPESRVAVPAAERPLSKSLNVRLDVNGDEFSLSVNGRLIERWNDSRLPSGGVGFTSSPDDRVRLYWVKLMHREPENADSEDRQP